MIESKVKGNCMIDEPGREVFRSSNSQILDFRPTRCEVREWWEEDVIFTVDDSVEFAEVGCGEEFPND